MSPIPTRPYVAPGGAGSDDDAPAPGRSAGAPTWPPPVYVDRPEVAAGAESAGGDGTEPFGARLRARLGGAAAPVGDGAREIARLCTAPELLEEATAALAEEARRRRTDVVVGLDPGGFILGPLVARQLGLPFVPVWRSTRGASEAGWTTVTYAAAEEDDERAISVADELREEVRGGARCYLVDGRLESDATLEASFRLVREGGGVVVGVGVIVDAREREGGYMADGHNLLVLNELS